MVKEKEQICLEAVSQVLRDNFSDGYFSIGGPKECAACLEKSVGEWKVYCVERGNEFDVKSHHNVVEACVDLIVRIGINDDPEDLIDRFYSLIIGAGDALALQFDCERYEASLARTGEPASLEDVENISMRCDARALAEYARQKGVSTLDLSDQERMMFCQEAQGAVDMLKEYDIDKLNPRPNPYKNLVTKKDATGQE